jgi:hypothetical protein
MMFVGITLPDRMSGGLEYPLDGVFKTMKNAVLTYLERPDIFSGWRSWNNAPVSRR